LGHCDNYGRLKQRCAQAVSNSVLNHMETVQEDTLEEIEHNLVGPVSVFAKPFPAVTGKHFWRLVKEFVRAEIGVRKVTLLAFGELMMELEGAVAIFVGCATVRQWSEKGTPLSYECEGGAPRLLQVRLIGYASQIINTGRHLSLSRSLRAGDFRSRSER